MTSAYNKNGLSITPTIFRTTTSISAYWTELDKSKVYFQGSLIISYPSHRGSALANDRQDFCFYHFQWIYMRGSCQLAAVYQKKNRSTLHVSELFQLAPAFSVSVSCQMFLRISADSETDRLSTLLVNRKKTRKILKVLTRVEQKWQEKQRKVTDPEEE